jgi:hypothetical protein
MRRLRGRSYLVRRLAERGNLLPSWWLREEASGSRSNLEIERPGPGFGTAGGGSTTLDSRRRSHGE